MRKQTLIIIASAALLAGLSGIASAETVQHRHQSANVPHPISEATLRKAKEQNATAYGLALANQPGRAAPNCADITCPGFALIGIGF